MNIKEVEGYKQINLNLLKLNFGENGKEIEKYLKMVINLYNQNCWGSETGGDSTNQEVTEDLICLTAIEAIELLLKVLQTTKILENDKVLSSLKDVFTSNIKQYNNMLDASDEALKYQYSMLLHATVTKEEVWPYM